MALEFRYSSVSRTECGHVRSVNQDALFASDSAGFWAVSDGMGGHSAGEIASALVVDRLKTVANSVERTNSKKLVKLAIQNANRELREQSAANGLRLAMGATAAVLGTHGARYFCLWVGDTRVYRMHANSFTQLTRDHRYVQQLVDLGALRADAVKTHPQRNILTRAVGLDGEIIVDECEGTVDAGDIFFITTDGVTDVCSDDEIATILQCQDLTSAADQIVRRCSERGSPDNLSFVLVQVSNQSHKN